MAEAALARARELPAPPSGDAAPGAAPGAAPEAAPEALRQVMRRWDADGVAYCHWKSNSGLARALAGESDLDLLVAATDRPGFEAAAREHGFIALQRDRSRQLPGVIDLLGFDPASGRQIHLHVHYQLVIGERYAKNHRLPVEDWLLSTCTRRLGMPIPDPAAELLLATLRAVLKTTAPGRARARLRRTTGLPASITAECQALLAEAGEARVLEALASSGLRIAPAGVSEFLTRLREDRIDPAYLGRRKREVLRELKPYCRYGPVHARARAIGLALRHDARVRAIWPARGKRLHAGAFVALVGADGSGKSTLVADLTRWAGWKMTVRPVYFGRPKRSAALRGLRRTSRAVSAVTRRPAARVDALTWLWLAHRRHRLATWSRRRAARGEIVLADRFPLPELHAMDQPMDGPRLQSSRSRRGLLGVLARAESACYARVGRPDLTLALVADPDVLRARKPETDEQEQRAKAVAVAGLPAQPGLVRLDASEPAAAVTLAARAAVWTAIEARA